MLRAFKSFHESLINDSTVEIGANYLQIDTNTPSGRPAIQGNNWPTKVYLNVLHNEQSTLDAKGSKVLYMGFLSNYARVTMNDTALVLIEFNTQSAGQTVYTKPLSSGWHWVECRIEKITTPALAFNLQVRIDGAEFRNEVVSTAIGSAIWSKVSLKAGLNMNSAYQNIRFMDVVLWDDVDDGSGMTSWMGPMQVNAVRPSAPGSVSQWLGSDGDSINNNLLVDETPASIVDYVESATDGQRDLYANAGLAAGLKPLGVKAVVYAQKNGAGLRSFKPVIRQSDGVNPEVLVVETPKILSNTPTFYSSEIYPKSMLHDAPWLNAEIAEVQFGVETSTPVQ